MRNVIAWIWEHWSDLAALILTIVAVLLAMIPGRVAKLEEHPRWGLFWKYGATGILGLIGVTGAMQGILNNDALRHQIALLSSSTIISATKDDVKSLTNHIDDGFNRVLNAITELCGKKPVQPTKPPKEVPPPAIVEHLAHTERRVASDKPDLPYALQIVLQTDQVRSNPGLEIDFDGVIGDGNFFVAGQAVMMAVQYGLTQDRKGFILRFGYPSWTPESPIVVTIYSKDAVQVTAIKNLR